jgi:hypothetical protein
MSVSFILSVKKLTDILSLAPQIFYLRQDKEVTLSVALIKLKGAQLECALAAKGKYWTRLTLAYLPEALVTMKKV